METNRWQLHRAGIINFWYYDKQEFDFAGGRMLLRGSNGSGKSVTMQSFIPLLLDGNRSPERLDPFGSKSRKLDNYLLEEQDDREERTAYLYLEFKQPDVDMYRTIGMGIRARKNAPLDTWYFYIGNGKRIGENFSLYRNKKETNVLTKRELKLELEQHGQVFDSQRDYMEEVNRRLFGFDSIEEYKELISLLIQLRSPKLSKDFKPTVISEILTSSLQPLSDEDLRPLSESIENMDAIEANLTSLNASKKAINRLTQSFIQYNSAVFRTRTMDFASQVEKLKNKQSEKAMIIENIEQKKLEWKDTKKLLEDLKREQEVRMKQVQDLEKQDVVGLKEKQVATSTKIKDETEQLYKKKSSIETKKESIRKIETEKKKQREKSELLEKDINSLFSEMKELAELLSFDEHRFFENELRNQLSKDYSYSLTDKAIQDLKVDLRNALKAVQHTADSQEKQDRSLKLKDKLVEERNKAEVNRKDWEDQLEEQKTEWTISLKHWMQDNQMMHLTTEVEEEMFHQVQNVQQENELSPITKLLQTEENRITRKLKEEEIQLNHYIGQLNIAVKEKEAEQKEWLDKVDPEPVRTSNVVKNRERLKARGIPFVPFYQTIDFQETLTDTEINRLEEILIEAGLLDALVIPQEYKEKVLQYEEGIQDCYLFADGQQGLSDLTDYFKLADQSESEWSGQDLKSCIEEIVNASGPSAAEIFPQKGMYHLGPLYGTVTGEYEAKFIGVLRRKQYREQILKQIQEELNDLNTEKYQLDMKLLLIQQSIEILGIEVQKFPNLDGISSAFQEIVRIDQELQFKRSKLIELEKEIRIIKDEYDKAKAISRRACSELGIGESIPLLKEAGEDSEKYQESLNQLKIKQHSYVSEKKQLEYKQERLGEADIELSDLLGEEGRFKRNIKDLKEELIVIQQQLDASGYEEVRQQLEEALIRLDQLPEEMTKATQTEARLQAQIESQTEKQAEVESICLYQKKKLAVIYQNYLDEVQLGYVFDEEERRNLYKEEIRTIWQGTDFSSEQLDQLNKKLLKELKELGNQSRYKENEKSIGDYASALQNEYIIQKNQLTEYAIQLKSIFYDREYPNLLPEYVLHFNRNDIQASLQGRHITLFDLQEYVKEQVDVNQQLLKEKDRILFEDVITNTISRKISAKIFTSEAWVKEMNGLMRQAEEATSNGFVLSLKWKHKAAQQEGELGTRELIDLLKMEVDLMTDTDAQKLTQHFRSKVKQARDQLSESNYSLTFHTMLKEVLDYRQWFEFQLSFKKTGEKMSELTNNKFFALSGGEKAISMYVPLFSAVVAKYRGARSDAPRIISLDEAFAGIDEQNIRDMFRYMVKFEFNFMINSQILWGDYDTIPNMRIYQLLRPNNAKFVTVIPYQWNGRKRTTLGLEEVKKIGDVQDALF